MLFLIYTIISAHLQDTERLQFTEIGKMSDIDTLIRGYCIGDLHVRDWNRVWFIENTEIHDSQHNKNYVINGENLIIHDNNNGEISMHDINELICNRVDCEGEGLDLILSFVSIDGEIGLHYREAVDRRLYDQGIFSLENEELEFLCTGRGGIEESH